VLTGLTRIASGYWSVSDPQNGYTAIATETLEEAGVADLFEYYGYCNELLVRLRVADATVRDVEIPATYGDEQSHIDYRTYVPKVSAMLFRNFLWRLAVTYLDPDGEPTGDRAGRYRPEPRVQSRSSRKSGTADERSPVEHHASSGTPAPSEDGTVDRARRQSARLVEGLLER
jgi:hypothetical protein